MGFDDLKSLSYFSSHLLTCFFKSRYQSKTSFDFLIRDKPKGKAIFKKKEDFLEAKKIFDKIESGEQITRGEAKKVLDVMTNYLFLLGITNIKVTSKNPLQAIEDMG